MCTSMLIFSIKLLNILVRLSLISLFDHDDDDDEPPPFFFYTLYIKMQLLNISMFVKIKEKRIVQ